MQENTSDKIENETPAAYRPSLTFYHANPKGTGCAIQLALHPAHGATEGCVFIRLANQKTVGCRTGSTPTFPTFDWENVIVAKLCFTDLAYFLQVFRGECESICDGRGIFHQTAKGLTNIALRHLVDPVSGYELDVRFRPTEISPRSKTCREAVGYEGCDEARAHIFFTTAEALGLCEAFASSMLYVGFGVPAVAETPSSLAD